MMLSAQGPGRCGRHRRVAPRGDFGWAVHPGGVPSPYGESEGREEGGERGERDVDDYAPAVLAFLGHNGLGWFGGFMSRSLRLM